MTNNTDIVDLAREIAEIARTTTDPETGRKLTELVKRLLEEGGLPPDDEDGGEEPPSGWVSDPVDCPGGQPSVASQAWSPESLESHTRRTVIARSEATKQARSKRAA